jgi:hypothetical protein
MVDTLPKKSKELRKVKWNLDSLTLPEEAEELFPNKVALVNKMRALEQDIKSYLKAKMLNVKEDILAGNAAVKRLVRILVEVDPRASEDTWSIQIRGKLDDSDARFLSVFSKIKVDFTSVD